PVMVWISPKRARILSGERGEDAPLDLLDRALARDPAKARRAGLAARGPATVVVDERARLRAIHIEALLHRLLAVVVALDQRLAGHVVLARDLRRIERQVVAAARSGMYAAAAQARDDLVVRHVDLEDVIERASCVLQRFGLRDGARESVEQ